jgi:hypothetical protein
MSGEAPEARPRLSVFGLVALVAVLVGVALLLVSTSNEHEAPFTATQAHPKLVDLRVVHQDGPRSAARLEGRVQVDDASARDVRYAVIVVDDRRHRVVPVAVGDPKPAAAAAADAGWDNAVASLRERFDWQPSGGERAVFFTPGGATSFAFTARLPENVLPVADPGRDLSVVLALTHGGDSVLWAVKLAYHG